MAHTASDVEERTGGWTVEELARWAVCDDPVCWPRGKWQQELCRRVEQAIRIAVRDAKLKE